MKNHKFEKTIFILEAIIIGLIIILGIIWYFGRSAQLRLEDINQNEESLRLTKRPLISSVPSFIDIKENMTAFDHNLAYAQVDNKKTNYSYPSEGLYIDSVNDEKFFLVSKHKDDFQPIFQDRGSHTYGGTPIPFSKPNSSLSYIGLSINDPSLIKDWKVEMVIDYRTYGSASPKKYFAFLGSLVKKACACGPSMIIKQLGTSKLVFIQEYDGVYWYKLRKPLLLNKEKLEIPDWHGSNSVRTFSDGGLRMQLFYTPNDREGKLFTQIDSFIFSDQNGINYRVITKKKDEFNGYSAYLANEERGFVTVKNNIITNNLELRLENHGLDPITIDNQSLSRIENVMGGALQSIELRDLDGKIIKTVFMDEIRSLVRGKTAAPDGYISVPLISVSELKPNALYYVVAHTKKDPTDSQIKDKKRILSWKMIGNFYYYYTAWSDMRYLYAVYSNEDNSVEIEEIKEKRFYSKTYENILHWQSDTYKKLSLSIALQPQIRDIQKILNNPEKRVWGAMLSESPDKYIDAVGAKFVREDKDYYGNMIKVYRRGNFLGYITSRLIITDYLYSKKEIKIEDKSVVYEIPQEWKDNKKLFQYILLLVRSNPFKHNYQVQEKSNEK